MRVLLLRERFSHMGRHSGYDCLGDALTAHPACRVSEVRRKLGSPPWRYGRRWQLEWLQTARRHATPFYSAESVGAELEVIARQARPGLEVVHLCYVENHLGLLAAWPWLKRRPLVGTVHQTAAWWGRDEVQRGCLGLLDAVVVTSRADADCWEARAPGRVHYVPRGVDSAFFHPQAPPIPSEAPRCLAVGDWCRDFEVLGEVIERVHARRPGTGFDLVIPEAKRAHPALERLAGHPAVTWHAKVPDEGLRGLYRRATVFLLPLLSCTNNNALLEAMACGAPCVLTDVGGARDYAGGGEAVLVPPGSGDAFAGAVLSLLDDPRRAAELGRRARRRVELEFGWPLIAEQTLDVYRAAAARRRRT